GFAPQMSAAWDGWPRLRISRYRGCPILCGELPLVSCARSKGWVFHERRPHTLPVFEESGCECNCGLRQLGEYPVLVRFNKPGFSRLHGTGAARRDIDG